MIIIHATYTCIKFAMMYDFHSDSLISIQCKPNNSTFIEFTPNISLCMQFTNQNNVGDNYHNQNYLSTSNLQ